MAMRLSVYAAQPSPYQDLRCETVFLGNQRVVAGHRGGVPDHSNSNRAGAAPAYVRPACRLVEQPQTVLVESGILQLALNRRQMDLSDHRAVPSFPDVRKSLTG